MYRGASLGSNVKLRAQKSFKKKGYFCPVQDPEMTNNSTFPAFPTNCWLMRFFLKKLLLCRRLFNFLFAQTGI
jgi:hypothetical protein